MEILYHVTREEGLDTNRIPVLFACRLCICITVEREKSSILFYNLAPCPIYKEKLHVPRHSLFSSPLRVVLLLHVLPCPFIYIKKNKLAYQHYAAFTFLFTTIYPLGVDRLSPYKELLPSAWRLLLSPWFLLCISRSLHRDILELWRTHRPVLALSCPLG